jgi:voltage-gated potassium channel
LVRRLLERYDVRVPATIRFLAVLTIVLWLAAGAAFYAFEGGSNQGVRSFDDALWWSMTTLSTVGYGDLYPSTGAGRVVALITMVLGIGVLGTLAGSLATAFIEARERATRGTRSWKMKDHLLVLGWNDRAAVAIDDFRADPRYLETEVVLVADLESAPTEVTALKFVRGNPTLRSVLERASAEKAAAAIVFARDPRDSHSDLETTIAVHTLRRMNPSVRISAELVDVKNREVLVDAGCDSAVGSTELASALLVRSVQDIGAFELVIDLLTNRGGAEFYRVPVPKEFVGKSYRDYALAMLDRSVSVVALARGSELFVNPELATRLETGFDAFVVAKVPPS